MEPKTHHHMYDCSNHVNVYERKYLGDGTYFQRGTAANLQVGDGFISFVGNPNAFDKIKLTVSEIKVKRDSGGAFKDPQTATDLYYEAIMRDENYSKASYIPLQRI